MGRIVVLTPTVQLQAGTWTGFGTGADNAMRLKDNTVNTGVQAQGTDAKTDVIVTLGTPGQSANERVQSITVRAYENNNTDTSGNVAGTVNASIDIASASGAYQNTGLAVNGMANSGYRVGQPLLTDTEGNEWTVSPAAWRIRLKYNSGSNVNAGLRIYELDAFCTILKKATVTVISPGNGATDASLVPTFAWTFNGDGETQTRYRVKVFNAAQYSITNFDPNSSPSYYDSGDVVSGLARHDLPVSKTLESSTPYRVYVKAAKDFNGVPWWSDWSQASFTTIAKPVVTVTAPAGTITASSNPSVYWSYSGVRSADTYEVKIFDSATYTASGFSPDTSTPDYDSGIKSGANTTESLGTVALDDGTYRAYVRQGFTDPNSGVLFSDWAYIQFTLTILRPAIPIITSVTPDEANGRVVIVVQGRDNLLNTQTASLDGTGTGSWTVTSNCSVTKSTTKAIDGGSLRLSSTASGTMYAQTPAGTSGMLVAPNQQYTAVANVAAGTTVRNALISILWYTASGTLISQSDGTAAAETTTFPGTQVTVTATSPATAQFAAVRLTVQATGAASELHYFDHIGFSPGALTMWFRGGLKNITRAFIKYSDDPTGFFLAGYVNNEIRQPDNTATQVYTFYDYEAPPGASRAYRAVVYADASGAQ